MVGVVGDVTIEQRLRDLASGLSTEPGVQEQLSREMAAHLALVRRSLPGQSEDWYFTSCEARARAILRRLLSQSPAAEAPSIDFSRWPKVTLPAEVAQQLLTHLTAKQQQVFQLLQNGCGIREAGRQLGVSHPAIIKHRKKIARAATALVPSPVKQIATALLVAALTFCGGRSAQAANRTWNNGAGANTNWNVGANWGGTAPSVSGADSLTFAGTSGLTNFNNFAANFGFDGFTFSSGAGAFLLQGNTVNLDTLGIVNNSTSLQTIDLNLVLAANSVVNAASGNVTINGAIGQSGTRTLTKQGNNILTLGGTAANTYGGLTTVSAGELDLNKTDGVDAIGSGGLSISSGAKTKLLNNNQINNSADVTVVGTFDLAGNNEAVDALTGGGTVTNSSSSTTSTFTIGSNNGGGTYSGTIKNGIGTIALVKNGTGTEILSGANTYSGGTTINAGTITAGNTAALGIGGLTMTGGFFELNGNNIALPFLIGTGGTVQQTANNATWTLTVGSANLNTTYGGVFMRSNGNRNLALSKTGTGTLTLTGNSDISDGFNGGVTISQGIINIQNSGALGTSGNNVTVNSGAALQAQGGISPEQDIALNGTGVSSDGVLRNISGNNTFSGALTLGSAVRINSDAGLLTLSGGLSGAFGLTLGGAGNITVSSAIASSVTTLTKDGNGVLTLSTASAHSGNTTISAGTLKLGTNNVLPNGSGKGDVSLTGTLDLNGFSDTINGLSGAGTVDNTSGAATYTLTVGGDNDTSTFSGLIQNTSGTVALTKTGTGALTLTTAHTYTGASTINGGVLNIQNNTALGTTAGGATVASGAALEMQGGIAVGTETLNLNGTGVSGGGALRNISGNNSYAGAVTLAGATRINSDAGLLTLGGGLSGAFGLTFGGAGDITVSGVIASSVTTLTKDGNGILTLSAASAHSGNTTISAGTLKLGANNVLPNGSGKGDISLTGTLDLNGFSDTINGLSGAGTVDNTSGAATYTLTVGGDNDTSTFSGLIQNSNGSVALTKTGTGILTLSGASANTHSGVTAVDAGELDLSKSAGINAVGGALTVGDGSGGANADIVKLLASHQIADAAAVTVASSGKFDLNGFDEKITSLANSGSVTINGTLHVVNAWANGAAAVVNLSGILTGGTFTVDGTVQGNGTLAANVVIGSGEAITISGANLNLTELTTMSGGQINGSHQLVNYGTIEGFGDINRPVQNPGYIRAINGTLIIQSLTGNQATGTLEASAGGTLQANGIQSWINDGRVILAGGTVIGGTISNNAAKIVTGYGTIASSVINSGTVLANTAGQTLTFSGAALVNASSGIITANTQYLVVNGVFTNAGTFTMLHGVGTFRGAVVNSGAWITDPTTNIFETNFIHTATGYVQMMADDVYIFTNDTSAADFVNQSAASNDWDSLDGKFLFASTLGTTQTFFTAGKNVGDLDTDGGFNDVVVSTLNPNLLASYSNNFALGTLELASNSDVQIFDSFTGDGQMAALFLVDLSLGAGSQLIISNNVQVYFINSNSFTSAQVTLLGNGGLHQLVLAATAAIPEPSVLLLWSVGLVTLHRIRRRNHLNTKGGNPQGQ